MEVVSLRSSNLSNKWEELEVLVEVQPARLVSVCSQLNKTHFLVKIRHQVGLEASSQHLADKEVHLETHRLLILNSSRLSVEALVNKLNPRALDNRILEVSLETNQVLDQELPVHPMVKTLQILAVSNNLELETREASLVSNNNKIR